MADQKPAHHGEVPPHEFPNSESIKRDAPRKPPARKDESVRDPVRAQRPPVEDEKQS